MQLDLANLSGRELRRLLDSARERGQAAQSYQILQEMARRREAGPAPRRGRRRPEEPRVIAIDLGDPLEPKGDDTLDVPAPPSLADGEEAGHQAPPLELTLDREPPRPRRPRRGPPALVVFAAGASVGVAAGVALGGWVGVGAPAVLPPPPKAVQAQAQTAPPAAVTPTAGPVVADLAPPPAPPVDPAAVEEVSAPQALEVAVASSETPPAASDAAVTAQAVETEDAPSDACEGAATPADRAICGDPELQRLQRELRRAYAEALDAHQDRTVLRQRQLAWRDARSGIGDPERLASLYEARIRKLESATADARRQR